MEKYQLRNDFHKEKKKEFYRFFSKQVPKSLFYLANIKIYKIKKDRFDKIVKNNSIKH